MFRLSPQFLTQFKIRWRCSRRVTGFQHGVTYLLWLIYGDTQSSASKRMDVEGVRLLKKALTRSTRKAYRKHLKRFKLFINLGLITLARLVRLIR